MAITIASTSELLNRFTIKHGKEINTALLRDMVSERVWTKVGGVDFAYASTSAETTGDVVQAFQCAVTPTNVDTEFKSNLWELQQMKIDLVYTCDDLNKWFNKFQSWRTQWGDGNPLLAWDFPRYLYNMHILPKVKNDMEMKAAYKGVRVAPTTGVAGTTLGSVNGMGKVLADGIVSGDIPSGNVITTGLITSANAVAKMETFAGGLPEEDLTQGGMLLCSEQTHRNFVRDMLERYGNGCCTTTPIGNPDLAARIAGTPIFNTNIRLVSLPSMTGSNRIIFSSMQDNLIWGNRTGEGMLPTIRWQEKDRTLTGLAEFHRFYGYENGKRLFVNEQV